MLLPNINTILNMDIEDIIYPGFRKIIPEYGFIRNQHQGNLIIEFIIEFPKKISDDQIDRIQNIF